MAKAIPTTTGHIILDIQPLRRWTRYEGAFQKWKSSPKLGYAQVRESYFTPMEDATIHIHISSVHIATSLAHIESLLVACLCSSVDHRHPNTSISMSEPVTTLVSN
jgi:hypothetical protein